LRQLWHVPTFFIGTIALLTVAVLRPLGAHGEQRHIDRALTAARRALERQPKPDLEEARMQAEDALRLAASTSQAAGEAHFILGSAALIEAEQASGEHGTALYERAKAHLEQADGLGTAEADRSRLAYRLGKVHAALGGDPQRVVACLSWSVPEGADSAFEAYALLAQAYLRLPTPDLRGALEATRQQLALPNADESMLAGPRLQCGELLLKLDLADEARKVLTRIGPGAPADVLLRARLLRARLHYDEGAWAEAARLWEEARGDARWEATDPARTLYYLGSCYRKLDQPAKALATWEECRQRGGDEAQAAALQVADLRLRSDQPATALESFAAAVRHIASPANYQNSLIDLAEARSRFELGCQVYRQNGLYDQGLQLARLYERIAQPGVGLELAGQAAESWARALQEQATRALTAPAARRDEEDAQQRYRQAGAAFERAADLTTNPIEQAEWLWRGANDFLDGQDRGRAVPVLERFVQLPQASDERRGQAWFLLGEAHRLLRNETAAQAAYQKCIEFPGLSANKARYELAMTRIEQKNYDDAAAELIDNLRQAPPGSEPHEKSLVTLGGLLFQRRNFSAAYRYLGNALQTYPANPQVHRLRLQYGQCCRQLADEASDRVTINDFSTPDARQHYRDQRSKMVDLASVQYKKLVDDLDGIRSNRPLTTEEASILRQAQFALAECRFELGKIEEALGLYNQLAERYKRQQEELTALRHVWQCHGVLFQPEQARTTLDRVRVALSEMPTSAFTGTSDTATRAWWENWVTEMSKLRDTAKPPR